MMRPAYCPRHEKLVDIVAPAWAPAALLWPAIRELLTGCICADPDPRAFGDLWEDEILPMLYELQEEASTGVISMRLRVVRGRPLSEFLDADEVARVLRLDDKGR